MFATAVTHGEAQLLSLTFPGKIKYQIWAGLICRNTCTPHTLPSCWYHLYSQILCPPPQGAESQGMEAAVSSSHLISVAPCSSLPLLHFGATPTGNNPPLISPVWVFLMGSSSSPTTPAWVPFTGFSLSGTGCSIVDPPQGHKSWQQICSSVGFALRRSCQEPAPGSQLSLGIHLL